MKLIILILVVFLAACSNTVNTDVKVAENLCGNYGWSSFEANNTFIAGQRRIEVTCKDNSIRTAAYIIKDWKDK
jgi:hypothetical protein